MAQRSKSTKNTYHHGDLRAAMIDAALRLVERKGAANFSMREAAREAGVAASAPYKHFADKTALMTAVAEIALERLLEHMDLAMRDAPASPLAQFRASGIAYVLFAARNPAQFRVLHDPEYTRADASELLAAHMARNRDMIATVLGTASASGELNAGLEPSLIELTASTLMYGLARRVVDGQFDEELSIEQIERLAELMTEVMGAGIANISMAHSPE